MSGPKVVRVVTREEMEAICARLLAQVRAAAADLLRTLQRTELHTDAIATDIESRVQALAERAKRGEYGSLQKQAPLVATFLRQEIGRYQAVAVAAAEKARHERQQLFDAATSVRDAIERAGGAVSPALDRVVQRARRAGSSELAGLRAEVDLAFRSMATGASAKVPTASTGLATKLSQGLEQQTLAQWLGSRPQRAQMSPQVDRLLAEIEVLGDDELLADFADRAATISREPSLERRRLLSDSMALDAVAHVRSLKEADSRRTQLGELAAELGAIAGDEAERARAEIEAMLESGDWTGADALIEAGRSLIERLIRDGAAQARRRAVLVGLAGLGYEVREGMETAWARDGRLVVARPGVTDYGVELGAPADASRLQMRVVGAERPAAPRSRQRDTDQENVWCGEVGELIASLGATGTDIVIERAQPVGATPLKSTQALGLKGDAENTVEARSPVGRMARPT